MKQHPTKTQMDNATRNAVEVYAEFSGMTKDNVVKECLVDGPIQRSVMMLMFAAL